MALPYVKNSTLIYLAVMALGIQFVNSLQIANLGSVYRLLGASSTSLPYLGLAAPVAGLVIQPLVGQFSDETFTRYGRRRPYIFGWSVLAIVSCFLVAWASTLWLAAMGMWLLSCSINGAIESVRALTGDVIPNEQKASAFSWQTILAGAGAGMAAALPYLLSRFFPSLPSGSHSLPLAFKISFIFSALLWFVCACFMLTRIHEHLPKHQKLYQTTKMKQARAPRQKLSSILRKLIKNLINMPPVMKQFGLVQIFTWIGLYAMWLYFSVAISQQIYGVPASPDLEGQPQYTRLLEKGALETNFYFSIYQYISVGYALILPFLVKRFSTRKVHGASLVMGASGLSLISFAHSGLLIMGGMVAVGIMWGSIMTLPYTIVASELPYNKMGIYLGIFNISITLPQVIGGMLLQPVYTYLFHYHAVNVILLSSVLILIGGVLTILQKPVARYRYKTELAQS